MKKNTGISIGIAVLGGGFLVLACITIAVLGILFMGSGDRTRSYEEVENAVVEVLHPAKVAVGDQFTVEVRIRNTADEQKILDSIDFEKPYHEGFEFLYTEPAYRSYRDFGVVEIYRTFDFQKKLPPGQFKSFTFHLSAVTPGEYAGWIFICVDSGTICNQYMIETEVEDRSYISEGSSGT